MLPTQLRVDTESEKRYEEECLLLSVKKDTGSSGDTLEKVWLDAVKQAVTFVPSQVQDVVVVVAQRLAKIRRPSAAVKLLNGADMVPEAIDVLISMGDFQGAMALATERAPALVDHVELAQHGGVSPLEALASQGAWERVYELAKTKNQLNEYIMLHVQTLLQHNSRMEALSVFDQQRLPKNEEAIAILLDLAKSVIADIMAPTPTTTGCADILKRVLTMASDGIGASHPERSRIQRLHFVAHLLFVLAQAEGAGRKRNVAKISVTLLRYTGDGDVPTYIAFYRAGQACQLVDWSNMEFVFFDRIVDVCDIMEDPNHGDIDNSDFLETDIPLP